MIINHNMMAMNSHRQLGVNSASKSKSIEKLSSGMRINRAGDDAAGLSISEKMRSQVRGLQQASRNSQDAISLIQTTEGALNESHDILQRMRELTVQAGNDSNAPEDRTAIKAEIDELNKELTRIAEKTKFNGKTVLDGTFSKQNFQIGANKGDSLEITKVASMTASGLGTSGIEVSTHSKAAAALDSIDGAIQAVSTTRSKLGAIQNRLEHTIKNLDVNAENTQAAESRIRDTDMAKEMMKFTKDNILSQAAQAMLSQANQAPQGVLQLLR